MKTELMHVDFRTELVILIIREHCLYGIRMSEVEDLVLFVSFLFLFYRGLNFT